MSSTFRATWNANLSWPTSIEQSYSSTCDARSNNFVLHNKDLLHDQQLLSTVVGLCFLVFQVGKLVVTFILTPSLPVENAKTWTLRWQEYHEDQAEKLKLQRPHAEKAARILTDNWNNDTKDRVLFHDILAKLGVKLLDMSNELGQRIFGQSIQRTQRAGTTEEKSIIKWLVPTHPGTGLSFKEFNQFYKDEHGHWVNHKGAICTSGHIRMFMEAYVAGTDEKSRRTLWLTLHAVAGNYQGPWKGNTEDFFLQRYNPNDDLLPLFISLKELVPGTDEFDSTKTRSYLKAKLSAPARKSLGFTIYMPWSQRTQVFISGAQLLYTSAQLWKVSIFGPPLFTNFYHWGFFLLTFRLSFMLPLLMIFARLLILTYYVCIFKGDPFRAVPGSFLHLQGNIILLDAGPMRRLVTVLRLTILAALSLTCLPFTLASVSAMFSGPPLPAWCWIFWLLAAIGVIVRFGPQSLAQLCSRVVFPEDAQAPLISQNHEQNAKQSQWLVPGWLMFTPFAFLPFLPILCIGGFWFLVSIFLGLRLPVASGKCQWGSSFAIWFLGMVVISFVSEVSSPTYLCIFSRVSLFEIDVHWESPLAFLLGILIPLALSSIVWLMPYIATALVHPVLIHKLWVFHSNDLLSIALSTERVKKLIDGSLNELEDKPVQGNVPETIDAYTKACDEWRELENKKKQLKETMHQPGSDLRVRLLAGGPLQHRWNRIGQLQYTKKGLAADVESASSSGVEARYFDQYEHLIVSFSDSKTGEQHVHVEPVRVDRIQISPNLLALGDRVVAKVRGNNRVATIQSASNNRADSYLVKFDKTFDLDGGAGDTLDVHESDLKVTVQVGGRQKEKSLKELKPGDKIVTGTLGSGGSHDLLTTPMRGRPSLGSEGSDLPPSPRPGDKIVTGTLGSGGSHDLLTTPMRGRPMLGSEGSDLPPSPRPSGYALVR